MHNAISITPSVPGGQVLKVLNIFGGAAMTEPRTGRPASRFTRSIHPRRISRKNPANFKTELLMLPILYYEGFDKKGSDKNFQKVLKQLTAGDFKSADVKKMPATGYYRAKLDVKDRLLFTFLIHQDRRYILLLEVITQHDYASSRFLRGAPLPVEEKLESLSSADDLKSDSCKPLTYLSGKSDRIHILNKFVSFDQTQASILELQTPLIIIGAAGSGKTILVLEKLKQLKGNIAYVSLSRYLVENARKIYYANGYDNDDQEIEFLSFQDYLQSWKIPEGREVDFRHFQQWFDRHAQHTRLKEAHRVFEEFKGVITGSSVDAAWLNREEYLGQGIKQSIFTPDKRPVVYELFEKYLRWMKEEHYFDTNILSFDYLPLIRERYDYVMIDEVQDITNSQLKAILQSLVHKQNFVLTGDSNQIVHPNFFSWSKVKSFFHGQAGHTPTQINILQTNYRNSREVVRLSNALLKIKNARFGSIDKESNYLVETVSPEVGEVTLLPDNDKVKADLNNKTQHSTRYAVIVSQDHLKPEAQRIFKTPLVFSVHEAKGLEYENVILLDFISGNPAAFNEIIQGVTPEDLAGQSLAYSRPADKRDKDAEVYKFFINSLYVAITRSIKNIYLFEKDPSHRILSLLSLRETREPLQVKEQRSDREDWLREAERLESQGKHEQAEMIRARIFGYDYMSPEEIERIRALALDPGKKEHEVKKERKVLFKYASENFRTDWIQALADLGFQRAVLFMKAVKQDRKDYDKSIRLGRLAEVRRLVEKYGVDFHADENGTTGLMLALYYGNRETVDLLLGEKADSGSITGDERTTPQFLLKGFYNRVIRKENFAPDETFLINYWYAIRPTSMAVQTSSQRFILGGHSMAYFLLIFMQAAAGERPHSVTFRNVNDKTGSGKVLAAYNMNMFTQFLQQLPDAILPPYRKKRPYINSILALNEIDKDSPYSKHVFKRVGHGWYTINPDLVIPDDPS